MLKTLPIPLRDRFPQPSSTSRPAHLRWPVFSCPSLAGFGCRPRVESGLLKNLVGFQIAARASRADHRLRIQLESAKPFSDIDLIAPDEGYTLVTSDGGRKFEATFTLPA